MPGVLTRLVCVPVLCGLLGGLWAVLGATALSACTTAVISGKATRDGRPLLWKNRDRKFVHNQVVQLSGGKYAAIGVANEENRQVIWMGVNSAGFCIENSVTNDLGVKGAKGLGNGSFMSQALKNCATVADFEAFLEETNASGRSTKANYGVIDAQGGAALFETSATTYQKFDANDPQTAPHGYVVRSNFSMTGQKFEQSVGPQELQELYSANRYLRAQELLNERAGGELDLTYLLRHCLRDLADEQGCCIPGSVNQREEPLPEFIDTQHTISRTTTVSAAVFQGVLPGEDPRWTTMWVTIGDPKFSVAIPSWPALTEIAPELQAKGERSLSQASHALRAEFFQEDSGGILTQGLPDCWQALWKIEDALLKTTGKHLSAWRNQPFQPDQATAVHQEACRLAWQGIQQQTLHKQRMQRQQPATSLAP